MYIQYPNSAPLYRTEPYVKKHTMTFLYIATIVGANLITATFGLVPIGFGLMVTAGTFMAGAALIVRDLLQDHASRTWMLCAIAVGAVASALTANTALAVASGIAFAVSELVDWGVFTPLRERGLVASGVVVSSLVASPIDTVLFLYLAGFGVTWQAVVGQVVVKTALALIVAGALTYRQRDAAPAL